MKPLDSLEIPGYDRPQSFLSGVAALLPEWPRSPTFWFLAVVSVVPLLQSAFLGLSVLNSRIWSHAPTQTGLSQEVMASLVPRLLCDGLKNAVYITMPDLEALSECFLPL